MGAETRVGPEPACNWCGYPDGFHASNCNRPASSTTEPVPPGAWVNRKGICERHGPFVECCNECVNDDLAYKWTWEASPAEPVPGDFEMKVEALIEEAHNAGARRRELWTGKPIAEVRAARQSLISAFQKLEEEIVQRDIERAVMVDRYDELAAELSRLREQVLTAEEARHAANDMSYHNQPLRLAPPSTWSLIRKLRRIAGEEATE